MKHNAQEELFSAQQLPRNTPKKTSEQKIQFYRKAWQEGSLEVDTTRLAQKIMDFEQQVENAFPLAPKKNHPFGTR